MELRKLYRKQEKEKQESAGHQPSFVKAQFDKFYNGKPSKVSMRRMKTLAKE